MWRRFLNGCDGLLGMDEADVMFLLLPCVIVLGGIGLCAALEFLS
jgi:hypothetical protein